MDFLQSVFNLLGNNAEPLKNLLKLLSDGSFDVKSLLGKLTPETLSQILSETLKSRPQSAENGTDENFDLSSPQGLSPIANLADKDVVFALNRYMSDCSE